MSTRKPTIGQDVHFVLNTGPNIGVHRPAKIVGVIDDIHVNLQVLSDGTKSFGDMLPNVFWKRGAALDENMKSPGTWHWPEEQE